MAPLTVTITQASRLLGISASSAYSLAATTGYLAPGVRALQLGRRWVVPRRDLEELLGPLPADLAA